MIDRLRAVARSPGWQLVIGGALLALLFPSRLSGSIGLAIVCGGIGVGIVRVWPRIPEAVRAPKNDIATAFVLTIIVALGFQTFWDAIAFSPDWQMGDWGPQHAVLSRIMPALPGIDPPAWNLAVGTGDAPLELYPKLAYLVTGHFALIAGLEDDLPLALMIVAVVVHIGLAALTTLLAMRIAPKPIACVIGILVLVDSGGVAHGGTVGLFRWGLLHSAMALVFALIAALGVLSAVMRPRLRASIAIWIGTALACAAHPAGLIAAAACIVALAAVALLASDVPARRPLVAIAHIVLGVALGAFMWMPLAERILDYGQHFPNPLRTASRLLEDLLHAPSPITAYSMVSYAGYFGILAALWSRRATAVFVAAVALVLLTGLCDMPYLALDLAPGRGVARLGTERLAQLARPFIAAAAAYGIWVFVAAALAAWRGASERRRWIAAAAIAVFVGVVVREVPTLWRSASARAYAETQVVAPDPSGRQALTAWAVGRAAEQRPDSFGRVLFEQETHEHFHLTAETGLPTLHLGPQPDLLLRERIEDLTPDSLRRFNVRWSIAAGSSPLFGDPTSEIVIGTFHIRTVKVWDGQFARVERGQGSVRVTRLDDEAVEIDVTAPGPVLVALGTGYYPRWRATHASGADEPVFAMRSTPSSNLSVVSAWVAPGKTTFTCDGPLPSDGKGSVLAVLAVLAAIGIVVVWLRPRWRRRALFAFARVRARAGKHAPRAAMFGVPIVLFALVLRGCVDSGGTLALEVGTGIRANATVEARLGANGAWQECDYHRVQALFICEGLLVVHDGMANLVNDALPSWPFNTPGIIASADIPGVEMRIRFRERLKGRYWTATSGDAVTLEVANEAPRVIDRALISYVDEGERSIELRAPVPVTIWQFTFVSESTINPKRDFLEPPPLSAPAEVAAIH